MMSDNNSFWKKHMMSLPGRPSPKKMPADQVHGTGSADSFQHFQQSVDDVWDERVGENEFSAITTNNARVPVTPDRNTFSVPTNAQHNNTPEVHKNIKRETVLFGSTIVNNGQNGACKSESTKMSKLKVLLEKSVLNLKELKDLSWSGLPTEVRADSWKLLAGYLPANSDRRREVLHRKRCDYLKLVQQYYNSNLDDSFSDTLHQIHIDVPRMSPLILIFQQKIVQEMFERILFIWAIRHPASGYVQGINDLVTPFFIVFLEEIIPQGADLNKFDVDTISKDIRNMVEADAFWCLTKFLESLQDNYIFAQLGIQHKVNQLKELISRIDATLHNHLIKHGVDYLQFSFRWMNNLLTRELPLRCSIRLWDTYLAELDNFASFQLYVCAAFLLRWKKELLTKHDFQGLMITLQNLPTQNWRDADIDVMVAEAFKLMTSFADAPNHLNGAK